MKPTKLGLSVFSRTFGIVDANLLPLALVALGIGFAYWTLLPNSALIDSLVHVPLLWDQGGWLTTTAYDYSRLSVQQRVFPYTVIFPDYPFQTLEYPFLAGYFFYGIYLVSAGRLEVFVAVFQWISIVFHALNVCLIYVLAQKFQSSRRSSILAAIYAASPSLLWFTMSRYDTIPTFFVLLSTVLYLKRKEGLSFLAMSVGTMFKFYPALLLLLYLKAGLKSRKPFKYYLALIGAPIGITLATLAPIILLNVGALTRYVTFYATFSWNWESIYGPVDQFLRPVLPSLALIYVEPNLMRAIFGFAILSTVLLDVRNDWQLVNAVAIAILSWIQTQWFFSPQYVMWVFPFMLVVATSKAIIGLYVASEVVSVLETTRPLFDLMPFSEFHYTLYASTARILLFFIVMAILIVRVHGALWREQLRRFTRRFRAEE